ncbi:hypothetical protein BR93DRAFT_933674 [Coniochaeta sp. PMI_546]|nr:hypothetical protein BR93DRAFT_933674 [Coniochaeta sp. PMI_546]
MDVSTLVSQMHDTLSTIHSTLASLNTTSHDARLDELERQRDSALSTLRDAFKQEANTLAEKRKIELDEIAEHRRREDEERERRRRIEDEQLAERNLEEDRERQLQLEKDTQDLEEETDGLMDEVEEDATRLLEEGKERLRQLEERRREINRLIDQKLKAPLPSAPSRRKIMRSVTSVPHVMAAESKIPVPNVADEQPGNPGVQASSEADLPVAQEIQSPRQASGSVGLPKLSVPEPEISGSTKSASLKEEMVSHGPIATANLPETDNEMLQRKYLMAGETADSSNLNPLQVPQDGFEAILPTEDTLKTRSPSTEQQAVLSYEPNEHEDVGTSDSIPTSIIGSWGRATRDVVGGQFAPEDSSTLYDSPSDSAQTGQDHVEGQLSTPRSLHAVQSIVNDEVLSALQSPEFGATNQFREIDKGLSPDYNCERKFTSNSESSHAVESNEPKSPNLQEATSRGAAMPQQLCDDDDAAEALIENHQEAPNPAYSDDQFAMTGQEAIPGTMTHGSDDSGSEIIEPISGTMTHGVDHSSSTEPEGSLQAATPIVEEAGSDSVSSSTDVDGPFDIAIREGAVITSAAKPHEDGAVSVGQDSAHDGGQDEIEKSEHIIQAPSRCVLATTPEDQAERNDSKLDQAQCRAVRQHGTFLEQDSSNSLFTTPFAGKLPGGEEPPANFGAASLANKPPNNNRDVHEELEVSPIEAAHQPDHEMDLQECPDSLRFHRTDKDVAGDEHSWSEDDSQGASCSQNESIEGISAANTSIESVLPASADALRAKNGVYLDDAIDRPHSTEESSFNLKHTNHVVDDDQTGPIPTTISAHDSVKDECQAAIKAGIPHDNGDDDHENDGLAPMQAGNARVSHEASAQRVRGALVSGGDVSQEDNPNLERQQLSITEGISIASHKPNDIDHDAEASHYADNSRFREHTRQPFQDDGDPVEHYRDREEGDTKVPTSDSHFQPPRHPAPPGWNNADLRFVTGHSDADTESQSSMTPLASAEFHTPMQFQEWHLTRKYRT